MYHCDDLFEEVILFNQLILYEGIWGKDIDEKHVTDNSI